MHSVERIMSKSATIPTPSLLCSSNTHEQPTQFQHHHSIVDSDFITGKQVTMSRSNPPSKPKPPPSLQIPVQSRNSLANETTAAGYRLCDTDSDSIWRGSELFRVIPSAQLTPLQRDSTQRNSSRMQISDYSPFVVKQEISPNTLPPPPPSPKTEKSTKRPLPLIHLQFSRVINELNEVAYSTLPSWPSLRCQFIKPLPSEDASHADVQCSIKVRFVSGGGSLSSRPVDEEEAEVDNEEKPMLKPLQWDQVRTSFDQAMVLVKPKSSSFQMIEAFLVNKSTVAPPKEQSRWEILPPLKPEDRLLDPKKLQNIAILLRALNETIKEVFETLLHGNANELPAGFFETLVKMARKKEVQFKFRNCNGDISKIKLQSIDIVLTNFAVNQVLKSLLISKMGFHSLPWAEAWPKSMIYLLLENQNFDLLAINMRKLRDDGYFCNSLIGLHVRCKDIVYACKIFDEMRERDVVSWINMIVGYIHHGDVSGSFRLFHDIRTSSIEPNSVTLVVVIQAFKVKEIVDGMKTCSGLFREKMLLLSAKFSCHSHKLVTFVCLKFLQENGQHIPNVISTFLDESGVLIQLMNELVIMHQRRKIFDPGIWLGCPPLTPSR